VLFLYVAVLELCRVIVSGCSLSVCSVRGTLSVYVSVSVGVHESCLSNSLTLFSQLIILV
jgi:hypothetical protein